MDPSYRINFTDYGAFRPRNARRCVICRARYKKSDRDVTDHCGFPALLPCGDLVCRLCIAHHLFVRKKRDCPVCRREFFEEFAGEVAKVAWVEEHRRQQRGNGRYDGMEAQEREGAAGRGSSTPADEIEEYPRVGSPMREEEERREMEELLLEIDYTCQGSPSEK